MLPSGFLFCFNRKSSLPRFVSFVQFILSHHVHLLPDGACITIEVLDTSLLVQITFFPQKFSSQPCLSSKYYRRPSSLPRPCLPERTVTVAAIAPAAILALVAVATAHQVVATAQAEAMALVRVVATAQAQAQEAAAITTKVLSPPPAPWAVKEAVGAEAKGCRAVATPPAGTKIHRWLRQSLSPRLR